MRVIGITGGVGCGKSALLQYIAGKYHCKILLADEVAHKVQEPGEVCYEGLISLLPSEVLNEDGTIHKGKMAAQIFQSETLLKKINDLIHPAVKKIILDEIAAARADEGLDFFFVEAALLIENGYLDIVDEMWYIYALEEVRYSRLRESRNYSDEKTAAIMKSQLTEEEFRKSCDFVVDNSNGLLEAFEQIDRKLGEYL